MPQLPAPLFPASARRPRRARALVLALLLSGTAISSALAQVTPAQAPGDPVVAKVDGEPILLSEVAQAASALPEELRGMPPALLYPLLLDQMISQRALVAAAKRAGLDRDEQVRARIRRAEERELQQALIAREIAGRVTDEAVRARYDREVAGRPQEEEIHARHILVATETEARQALAEIRGGADFAEVARRRSTGPGAQEGGDLGFFKRGDLVPEFAEAAFALQAGQTTEDPVRTPFGWHLIKVEERRSAPPPAFEEVKDTLRQQVFEEEVTAAVDRVRGAAAVERFNLDGSPQRPTDSAEPPPPVAPPAPSAPRR